jgi:D-galactose 1-dehydrogenase
VSSGLRIGLVGLGKIARDQHLPAIEKVNGGTIVAIATRNAVHESVPVFYDAETMIREGPEIDAVVMCQPPQGRFTAAWAALRAGKHVFLEKPPGATVAEVTGLVRLAEEEGVTLFASWHSRYAAAVPAARDWLASRVLRRAAIVWKEDVRHWHPGQDWIFASGGMGVFDPGINALSILTAVVPEPLRVIQAEVETPSNRQAPIAATLSMSTASGKPISVEFDFLQTGQQTWDIVLETEQEIAVLGHGGNSLTIDGAEQPVPSEEEYPAMYRHFLDLVVRGQSDVDLTPLQLVADAYLCGRNTAVEPFEF